MIISGFTGVSLLDYPGKVSSIVYTSPCNFRCPFCHNPALVKNTSPEIDPADVMRELSERKGFVEAVTITGGEPLMHKGLPDFLRAVKKEGLLVKIDTNGAYPEMLETILDEKLVDFTAMDIKSSPEKYSSACGVEGADIEKIRRSIKALLSSKTNSCFRTTAAPGLVEPEDMREIGKMIEGAEYYILQQFSNENTLSEKFKNIKPYPYTMLLSMAETVRPYVKRAEIHNIAGELTGRP